MVRVLGSLFLSRVSIVGVLCLFSLCVYLGWFRGVGGRLWGRVKVIFWLGGSGI